MFTPVEKNEVSTLYHSESANPNHWIARLRTYKDGTIIVTERIIQDIRTNNFLDILKYKGNNHDDACDVYYSIVDTNR